MNTVTAFSPQPPSQETVVLLFHLPPILLEDIVLDKFWLSSIHQRLPDSKPLQPAVHLTRPSPCSIPQAALTAPAFLGRPAAPGTSSNPKLLQLATRH